MGGLVAMAAWEGFSMCSKCKQLHRTGHMYIKVCHILLGKKYAFTMYIIVM